MRKLLAKPSRISKGMRRRMPFQVQHLASFHLQHWSVQGADANAGELCGKCEGDEPKVTIHSMFTCGRAPCIFLGSAQKWASAALELLKNKLEQLVCTGTIHKVPFPSPISVITAVQHQSVVRESQSQFNLKFGSRNFLVQMHREFKHKNANWTSAELPLQWDRHSLCLGTQQAQLPRLLG